MWFAVASPAVVWPGGRKGPWAGGLTLAPTRQSATFSTGSLVVTARSLDCHCRNLRCTSIMSVFAVCHSYHGRSPDTFLFRFFKAHRSEEPDSINVHAAFRRSRPPSYRQVAPARRRYVNIIYDRKYYLLSNTRSENRCPLLTKFLQAGFMHSYTTQEPSFCFCSLLAVIRCRQTWQLSPLAIVRVLSSGFAIPRCT